MISRGFTRQATRCAAADAIVWAFIALAFAAQGHVVASYRGVPQPWWPSFGYSLAIFSVWALLTPLIFAAVCRGKDRLKHWWQRAAALAAGLPIVSALHVMAFSLIYWPVYNGGGAIPSRLAMAERMALRNLDTNGLFYLLVAGAAIAWTARARRANETSVERAGEITEPPPLRVRDRGRIRFLKPTDIDWVGAAGDYAEVHAGGQAHLVETSLAHSSASSQQSSSPASTAGQSFGWIGSPRCEGWGGAMRWCCSRTAKSFG